MPRCYARPRDDPQRANSDVGRHHVCSPENRWSSIQTKGTGSACTSSRTASNLLNLPMGQTWRNFNDVWPTLSRAHSIMSSGHVVAYTTSAQLSATKSSSNVTGKGVSLNAGGKPRSTSRRWAATITPCGRVVPTGRCSRRCRDRSEAGPRSHQPARENGLAPPRRPVSLRRSSMRRGQRRLEPCPA